MTNVRICGLLWWHLCSVQQPIDVMQTDLLFQNATHATFAALIADKSISRTEMDRSNLSMELKYDLIRLSSLGVIVFLEDRIQLADGMESWMQLYWSEVSRTW